MFNLCLGDQDGRQSDPFFLITILLHLPPELEVGPGEVSSGIRHCKDKATTTRLMVCKLGIHAMVAAGVQMLWRHLVGCSKGLLPSATSPRPTWGFPQGSFLAQWLQSLDDPWKLLSNLYLSKKSCPTRHPALLGRISSLTCLSFGHPLSLALGRRKLSCTCQAQHFSDAACWPLTVILGCFGIPMPLGLQAGPISVSTYVPNSISSFCVSLGSPAAGRPVILQ